jgi:hypothetical protein
VKRLAVAGVALALAATLGGCGSPEENYCKAITRDQAKLSAMINSSAKDSLITNLPLLKSLAAEAPDDLTDEWQTFVNAIEGLRDALHNAGVEPADFTDDKIPASVGSQQRRTILAADDTLGSAEVVSSADGIETQARDVCKVNLGL